GMYVGFDRTFKVGNDPKALAQATSVMTRDGCRRIVRYAFEYARQHDRRKVTVVHKANILKATSGLFLETARMIAKEYEGQIASDEKIVDNAAMQLVINPAQFDVIVTTNLFGDILSDEASGLVGGLGIAPGDLCASCTRDVTRRASRMGRLVAIVTTLLLAGYLMLTLRSMPLESQTTARTVGAVAAVAWYLLTFRIVQRFAFEWLKSRRP